MSDELDEIRRELEEVRKLKESLKEELKDVRESRAKAKRREKELRREARRVKRVKPPKPPKPLKPARIPRIDLSGLTERLDTEMERIGLQLEKGLEGLEVAIGETGPFFTGLKRTKLSDREIERIGPERVARVLSPLGSVERLRILNFLKDGPKTFNDLEMQTGKTGSSLTHHLSPLIEARYVIKGAVRGTYYVTVEGRLAYRLAQWITSKVEGERNGTDVEGDVDITFDDEGPEDLEELEERVEELEELQDELHDEMDEVQDLEEELEDAHMEEDE
jgi:DNA-binding transcriptional ArsR family regulator